MDAMLGAFGHTCVHQFTTVPFLRALITPMLPQPGDGPPAALLAGADWKLTVHGWTVEEGKKLGKRCQVGCCFLGLPLLALTCSCPATLAQVLTVARC